MKIEKPPVLPPEEIDSICEEAGLGGADWDEGGGYVPESVVGAIQQAKAEVAREIFEDFGKYHTDTPHQGWALYLTEIEWQVFKSKYLKEDK